MRLLSRNAARILARLLASPDDAFYGYKLMQDTGIKSGSLYPILARFEDLGWITGHARPSIGGRPPRRVYMVDTSAQPQMEKALTRFFDAKGVTREKRCKWASL